MTTDIPVKQVHDLSGGMVSFADMDLLREDTSTLSINFNYDLLGNAQQRSGITLLGAQVNAGNACQGLAQIRTSGAVTNRLMATFNGTNYSFDGTVWNTLDSVSSTTLPVRYAQFLDRMFRVGGGSATMSSDGVSSFNTTQVANAPSGTFLIPYKQRLYVAGNSTYPDRLFFSTIADVSLNISWNQTTQYLDVNPEDGNNITALGKIANLMLIWKDRAMYRWNGSATDAEIIVDIGCSSQESVAQVKGQVYFFNPLGIFTSNGGYPVEISRPVYDWIQNMSSSNYSTVAGFADNDHYYCFIGNVTFTKLKLSRTFTNVMLVYTVSSQDWTVYSFPQIFKVLTKYVNSSNAVTYVGGDSVGNVFTMFSGNTDNGTAITYEYESKNFYFDSKGTTKVISDICVYIDNGAGGQVLIAPDASPFQMVGEVTNPYNIFKSLNIRGHEFRLRLQGSNKNTPVIFDGFEFTKVQSLGYLTKN